MSFWFNEVLNFTCWKQSLQSSFPFSALNSVGAIFKLLTKYNYMYRHIYTLCNSFLTDLQDLFHKSGQNVDGKLTYQEIWNSLGSAIPVAESLSEFDVDGDGRYSFLELRVALGV